MYYPPIIEFMVRQISNRICLSKKTGKNNISNKIALSDLKELLLKFPIQKGDSIMVHSSFSCIDSTASDIIDLLRFLVGEKGTISMPTHPILKKKQDYFIYDINESKSRVGYLTEFFRKMNGTQRSSHPFSTLAIQGEKAQLYLKDELELNSLPHGKNSPYHKFCQDNGKVLCIGVTAIGRATVKHVAEEVLDQDYPLKNIFTRKKVKIYNSGVFIKDIIVRERTDSLIPYLAKSRLDRDWNRAKLVIKTSCANHPVELLNAKKCFEWMTKKALEGYTMYPFAHYNPKYK